MKTRGRGQRGPEKDPKDRGRLKRLSKQVNDLMDSDTFIDALVECATDEKALAELRANARSYFRGKGSNIPDEVEVEFIEESQWCFIICVGWWIFRKCWQVCIIVEPA